MRENHDVKSRGYEATNLTGLEPLWPSRCNNSSSGKIFSPGTKVKVWSQGLGEKHTVDCVHDLQRAVGILVLEAFKDKIHIGCDWISDRCEHEGGNGYRLLRKCSPAG
jgi:hypothetical protein